MESHKAHVQKFWDRAACGEEVFLRGEHAGAYAGQARLRYQLEPYISSFANFPAWRGKSVLEIGVGLGADHECFAAAGAQLTGIDLTPRAVAHTRRRLRLAGFNPCVGVADAESLPFTDNTFDLVFSWGVLHHSPDTQRTIAEVHRVLKPGGTAKIMIYQKFSFVGFMLWVRYALLRARPLTTLDEIYARFLESPGTKAYSIRGAKHLLQRFATISINVDLSHGDLLSPFAGQRHQGALLSAARLVWPRWLIRRFFRRFGLFMLISAVK